MERSISCFFQNRVQDWYYYHARYSIILCNLRFCSHKIVNKSFFFFVKNKKYNNNLLYDKISDVLMQIEIQVKATYKNLVPRLAPEERKALKESIQIHGQREPIVINEKGIILDGHTRFEICQDLGLTPKVRIEKFVTETLERGYVIEANLKRRQLNDFQKVELAQSLYHELREDGFKRRRGHTGKYVGRSDVNLGREIGVGRAQVAYSLYLLKHARPDELKRLRNGTLAITTAYDRYHSKRLKYKRNVYIPNKANVECPHCHTTFSRKDLIIK